MESHEIVRILPGAFIAAFVTVVLLLALRPLAASLKLVDKPGGRKRHVGHVPIIGGICMFFGFVVGSTLSTSGADTFFIGLGAALLVFVGVIDDRHDLPPAVRFGAQVSATLLMIFGANVNVITLGDPFAMGEIQVGLFMLPITVILVVAVINAINMTDGMDGLAGGFSLVALVGLSIAGISLPAAALAIISAAVVASFLVFNFPIKANRSIRTFMGDAGSTFLGFVIGWLCVAVTQPPNAAVSPVVALSFVALPLFDLTSCFFRRILAGRSPFTADRNHFHHVLQEAGLSRRQILAVLLSLATLVMAVCFGLHTQGVPDVFVFLVWVSFGLAIDASLRRYRSSHDRRALPRT